MLIGWLLLNNDLQQQLAGSETAYPINRRRDSTSPLHQDGRCRLQTTRDASQVPKELTIPANRLPKENNPSHASRANPKRKSATAAAAVDSHYR